jgi:RNA polymerase sigma factor (sigma-70 family)
MAEQEDMSLVREFAESGSEPAFAELVRRHVDMVYCAALRRVSHAHDAEDVTQVVFLILARKAKKLSPRTVVAGWLYETTRFTSKKLLRARLRREIRQQDAAMQTVNSEVASEETWSRVGPLLEEGMEKLSANERAILVMRFFENKSAAETAGVLGIGEWAAHKRTVRAVDKLRHHFSKNGVTLTSVIIGATISGNSVQAAPIGLAGTVTSTAVHGAAVNSSTITLVKGTMKIMAWSKIKIAVAIGAAAVLVGAGTAKVVAKKIAVGDAAEYEGTTQIKVTGADAVQIDGFYVLDGKRILFTNSLPWSFSRERISSFELHKPKPNETINISVKYDSHGIHAENFTVLDARADRFECTVRNGIISVVRPVK